MNTVSALEAKTRFGELLDRVARGDEIIITRNDKPVARIVPEGERNLKAVRMGVAALKQLQVKILKRTRGKAPLSDADVKSAIDEGRL